MYAAKCKSIERPYLIANDTEAIVRNMGPRTHGAGVLKVIWKTTGLALHMHHELHRVGT